MKSQKLYVWYTTLWRRARQDISRHIADEVELVNNHDSSYTSTSCIVTSVEHSNDVVELMDSAFANDAFCIYNDVFTDVSNEINLGFETSVGWRWLLRCLAGFLQHFK